MTTRKEVCTCSVQMHWNLRFRGPSVFSCQYQKKSSFQQSQNQLHCCVVYEVEKAEGFSWRFISHLLLACPKDTKSLALKPGLLCAEPTVGHEKSSMKVAWSRASRAQSGDSSKAFWKNPCPKRRALNLREDHPGDKEIRRRAAVW